MTYLVIGETKYPLDEAMARPTLNDLVALKVQTGMGMKSLKAGIDRFDALGGDIEAISEDVAVLDTIRALVWLVRRVAGERLTFDEANDFPLDELSFEGVEEAPDEDPTTAPTDTAPAAEGAVLALTGTPPSTRTSAERF